MPAMTDVGAVARFYSYAFLHTQASVQVMTVLVFAFLLWLSKDLMRDTLKPHRRLM